nr:dihydrofolate reductase [Kocuria atrinae]
MSAAHSMPEPAAKQGRPIVGGIWAQSPQGVIGKDGTIPWHVPEDLRFFSITTTGNPVIMGAARGNPSPLNSAPCRPDPTSW